MVRVRAQDIRRTVTLVIMDELNHRITGLRAHIQMPDQMACQNLTATIMRWRMGQTITDTFPIEHDIPERHPSHSSTVVVVFIQYPEVNNPTRQ
jgi:hypothetical protein